MTISEIQSLTGKVIRDVTFGMPGLVHINFTDGPSIEVAADTLRWADDLDDPRRDDDLRRYAVPIMSRAQPAPRAHASDGECVHRKRILCADGHSISAQASSYHWCEPRDNSFANLWLYDYVECGYPELPDGTGCQPAELEEHRELDSSIYTYVPIRALAAFVQAHGGQIGGGEIVTNY